MKRGPRLLARLLLASYLSVDACSLRAPPAPPSPPPLVAPPVEGQSPRPFAATAYSIKGRTASGGRTRKGVVAADPAVLRLGSRIRVHGAGAYDGEYVVTDTGRKINGHAIDIFVPNPRAAKRFGRKRVMVEVVSSGRRRSAEARD